MISADRGGRALISIHAPPRGATRSGQSRVHGFFIFQFTPLREGRRNQRGEAVRRVNISIHAPPRGATGCAQATKDSCFISIHAPPRGATGNWVRKIKTIDISIHAPPRGATNNGGLQSYRKLHFNSRPSARGDTIIVKKGFVHPISIHAPPRGATGLVSFQHGADGVISIHAPPRGAT